MVNSDDYKPMADGGGDDVDWMRMLIRDGISQATLIASGSATLIVTRGWRFLTVHTFVHSLAGTAATWRARVDLSPNGMTGVPPQVNLAAKWMPLTYGATYSGTAIGLRAIFVPEDQLGEYARVTWSTSGTNPRAKVSIWAGFRS